MHRHRDMGIGRIAARNRRSCYGMGLGIIILDDVYPGFPGDVRNASGYPYPVQLELLKNVDIKALVYEEDKRPCLEPIRRAAKNLERMGCRAIAAECGYFSWFQQDIAGYVDIPVFMSSLLQVTWAQRLIGPGQTVGIMVGRRSTVRDRHLQAVGVDLNSGFVLAGASDEYGCVQFQHLWSQDNRTDPPGAAYAAAERDFVAACVDFADRHPSMGALVLECTGFPPFARAVQRAVDLPVFSWGTLLDFAYSVAVHRDFYGHV